MKFSVCALLLAILSAVVDVEIAAAAGPSSLAHAPRALTGVNSVDKTFHRRLSDSESEDSAEEEEEEEKEMAYTAYGAVGSAVILSAVGLFQWNRQRRVQADDTATYHLNGDDNREVQMV